MAAKNYALLMDLDGTIADTLPHLFDSFRYAVAPFVAVPPTDEEIYATFGPPETDCIAQLLKHKAGGQTADAAFLAQAAERYHHHYEGHHERVKAFPGVLDVIRWATGNGWHFGVCTGKGRRSAKFTLDQLGFAEHVDCLITGEDVKRPKPDPEGVRLALEHWRLEPTRLIVVGDAPADIIAGKKAGARTAAAMWGAFDVEAVRQAGPTWMPKNAGELKDILAGHQRQ